MNKLLVLLVLGLFHQSYAFGSDPILDYVWDFSDGSKLTFGSDNSYKDGSHQASGTYEIVLAMNGNDSLKSGKVALHITSSNSPDWPKASYPNVAVVWSRTDLMKDVTTTNTITTPDPKDPTKTITTTETVTTQVKYGNKYTLVVTADPGSLTATRQDNNINFPVAMSP